MIRVFGLERLRVEVGQEGKSLTSSPRLAAYLAAHADRPISRRQMAADLWPDADSTAAANRLRVALVKLRDVFGSDLLDHHGEVQLKPESLWADWREVSNRLKESADFVSAAEELAALEELFPSLGAPLLSEIDEAWAIPFKEEWSIAATDAAIRAAECAWELKLFAKARMAARLGLNHDPYSSALWSVFLKASSAVGNTESVVDAFRKARLRRKADLDSDFPEDLVELAKDLENNSSPWGVGETFFSDAEKTSASYVIELLVERNPDLAVEVFGARETVMALARYSAATGSLLDRIIHRTERRDLPWQMCVARAISSRAMNSDMEGVLELAPLVLEVSQEPRIRRVVLISVSFAQSCRRDWKGAMASIEEAIQLAEEMEDQVHLIGGKTNKASYLWQQGYFEEADQLFRESIEALEKLDDPRTPHELALTIGNHAFLPVILGDYEEGRRRTEAAYSLALEHGMKDVLAIYMCCLAMMRISQGESTGTTELTVRGLRAAYQMGADRVQQIALEYSAGALAQLGDGTGANAVLEWVNEWRLRTGYTRTVGEKILTDRIEESAPTDSPPEKLEAKMSFSQVAYWLIKRMRAAASRPSS